ncbi:MAG TPA: nucleotide sugar dehydrogenase [Chloroflexia bacterium]|nr:nucleotide sugar dehydrogenase [Chloroflexia bacterium]
MAEFTVAVVGLGKIGLPLAARFAQSGLRVTGCDINPDVVAEVNAGRSHVKQESGLEEAVASAVSQGLLRATTDTASAVRESNVVVVIVPVVVDEERNVDYRGIDAATRAVAEGLQRGTLVLYETTLPVGTTRTRFGPALEGVSGLRAGEDFCLAFSPERVYSGRIFRDLEQYPKVVGGTTPECTRRAAEFYRVALGGAPVMEMQDADTAELVKLMETTYRDVNIALANEFARFASARGLPVDQAIAAANSQPFSHIHRPGIAVGGHCIPVYPYFLINYAGESEMNLPRLSRRINDDMAHWALQRLSQELGGLEGKRVLVLGLSYRENVKEPIFSGGVRLISLLREAGAVPLVNDPLFTDDEIAAYGAVPASLVDLPAIDAAIVQAYHNRYRDVDWHALARSGCSVVLDGRNSIDPMAVRASNMTYLGMGR